MKRAVLTMMGVVLVAAVLTAMSVGRSSWALTQPLPAPATVASRFRTLDVYLDPHAHTLAAYQIDLKAKSPNVLIVGVEGGEHPAFRDAPYYDPAALHNQNRIIIAAFNTGEELPSGKTRVARLHLQITGDRELEFATRLMAAAGSDGNKIDATITLGQGEPQ